MAQRGFTLLERQLLEALRPFASFADPRQRVPNTLPITNGSSMARQQLTMGDCYRAANAVDNAEALGS